MNKEQFYNIISDSSLLANVDEQSIDEIINEFPYFQTAYILKTKILSDKGSFKYDNFIKLASLYSVDRSKLFNYLHNEAVITESVAGNVDELQEDKELAKDIISNIDNNIKPKKIESEKQEIKSEIIEDNKSNDVERLDELEEVITVNSDNIEQVLYDKPEVVDADNLEKITGEKIEEKVDIDSEIVEDKSNKDKLTTPQKTDNKKTNKHKLNKIKEDDKAKPLSANATLAEKIIHKYKHQQKSDKKESIADIILRKAAEAKKKKTTEKSKPVLREKPKEIIVEEKTFEPVKIDAEPKQVLKEVNENIKTKEPVVELDKIKLEAVNKVSETDDDISKVEILDKKEQEVDILDEINKISEKETVSDYFIDEEAPKTKPVKDKMSFDDWLTFVETPIKTSGTNKEQISLIDKFITAETETKIKPKVDISTDTEQLVKSGEVERDDFITETLANIYIKQKLYEKAIGAFTKLSLKYPEKNSYFANQIKKIEKLIKK